MIDKGAKQIFFMLKRAAAFSGGSGQGVQFESGEVGKVVDFHVRPEIFHRIEFRCVGRQEESIKAPIAAKIIFNGFGPMGGEAVPDQHRRFAKLLLKLLYKAQNQIGINVLAGVEAKEEPHTVLVRGNTKGGDGRNLFV